MHPRLLYHSDVFPDDSGAGASLVYRLLKCYPRDKLVVSRPQPPHASHRSIAYESFKPMPKALELLLGRLDRSRLNRFAAALRWGNSFRTNYLKKQFGSFQPQAIATVAHGYAWHTSALLANQLQVPLIMLVHDAFQYTIRLPKYAGKIALTTFEKTFREAHSVACVSPYMTQHYWETLGRRSATLLPCRDKDNPVFCPIRKDRYNRRLVLGYAGGLHNVGYRQLVMRSANIAINQGWQFLLYGPNPPADLALNESVRYMGNVDSSQLIQKLNETVDVLFCPQSFDTNEKEAMETNFPSKLADYTAAALPLLICAPAYASSAKWAREMDGVALLANQDSTDLLESCLRSLENDDLRFALASRASQVGKDLFSHEIGSNSFMQLLPKL